MVPSLADGAAPTRYNIVTIPEGSIGYEFEAAFFLQRERFRAYEPLMIQDGADNVHKYLRPLLSLIQNNRIDPSFVITHSLGLKDAKSAYETYKNNKDDCIKVVMKPELN